MTVTDPDFVFWIRLEIIWLQTVSPAIAVETPSTYVDALLWFPWTIVNTTWTATLHVGQHACRIWHEKWFDKREKYMKRAWNILSPSQAAYKCHIGTFVKSSHPPKFAQ